MLKAVFFDHDGTMVNSEVEHCRFWQTILQQYDINLSEGEYMAKYCGVPSFINSQMLIDEYGLAISANVLSEQKNTVTQAYLDKQPYPLMPHVREALAYFKDVGLQQSVVSGAVEKCVLATLDGHDIAEYFEFICSAEDVANNKPDPALYRLAVEKSGFDTSECIAIEDSAVGVQSAIEAGLVCCAIRNNYAANQDLSLATVVVDSMAEAQRWVQANYIR